MAVQLSYIYDQEADRSFAAGGTAKREPEAMKHGLEFSWSGLIAYTGTVFFVGWIASAGFFQVAGHWQTAKTLQTVETKTIPALKSAPLCSKHT